MSFFLTSEEVIELTGRKLSRRQEEALKQMGIEYKKRPDGSIVVLRAHVEKEMGIELPKFAFKARKEPNWKAIHA